MANAFLRLVITRRLPSRSAPYLCKIDTRSNKVVTPHSLLPLLPADPSFASKVLSTTITAIGECCSELATEVAFQSERIPFARFILAAISTMEIGGDESSVQLAILL
ncbi:hypothetical protein EJB05_15833, partial [Eragrostis curvula]